MILLILLFGGLMTIAGLLLMMRPALVIGLMESHGDRVWLYATAVGARVLLGLVLIQQAVHSKFPLLIEVFGWISLAAAMFLAALGRRRFERFMRWIIAKVKPFAGVGGLFAVVFGVFLVYAFL